MADLEDHIIKKAKVLRETPRALLVQFDGEEKWIPKSCISDDSSVYSAKEGEQEGELRVVGWWAAENLE